MKPLLLLITIFCGLHFSLSAQRVVQWAANIGTSSLEQGTEICADADDNFYVAGTYFDSLIICNDTLPVVQQPSAGHGTENLFISKFDRNRNCIWTKTGISLLEPISYGVGPRILAMEFYNGSIYAVGNFTHTMIFDNDTLFNPTCLDFCASMFLICIDALTGTISWSRCFEGSDSYTGPTAVIPYPDGVFVSGWFDNYLRVDSVYLTTPLLLNDAGYLLRFNTSGKCLWGRRVGTDSNNVTGVTDMAYDRGKYLYLTGYYADTLIFPGDTLIYTGPDFTPPTYFAKYDTAGNFIWAKGGMDEVKGFIYSGCQITYANNGHIYFTGTIGDTLWLDNLTLVPEQPGRHFIAQMDSTGAFIWAKTTGESLLPSQDFDPSLEANSLGFIHFTGFGDSATLGGQTVFSNGGLDAVLVQYDFDGDVIYFKNFGGANQEIATDASCAGNSIYFTGRTMSNYAIDSFAISTNGWADILVGVIKDNTIKTGTGDLPELAGSFLLYPNPSSGVVHILSNKPIAELSVRNVLGELLLSVKPQANYYTFEPREPGCYLVTVFDGEKMTTKKLVITR